ncbi:MAG: RNA polymerase sigma factor, partial [Bacteroidales bacterium]
FFVRRLHAVTRGDELALNEFYTRYADDLFAVLYHQLGGERQSVEDVWQETLLAGLRALPSYQGQSQLFTWLCAIARRKAADYFRRNGRTFDWVELDASPDEDGPLEVRLLAAAAPLPEEMLLKRETKLRVVQTLNQLSPEYRLALVARYAEQQGVDEVARSLGKTYKATESLLSRARCAFQTAFRRLGGDK